MKLTSVDGSQQITSPLLSPWQSIRRLVDETQILFSSARARRINRPNRTENNRVSEFYRLFSKALLLEASLHFSALRNNRLIEIKTYLAAARLIEDFAKCVSF